MKRLLGVVALGALVASGAAEAADRSFDERVSELARARVRDVLAARDAALVAPAPSGPRAEGFREALRELSRAADGLAAAARDGGDLSAAAGELAARVERAYDLAL